MKGDPKVIDYLNKGLRSELTAVNQYWLHFRLLEDSGYTELAKKWRKESIEEMHHADRFVDRIIFLEGFPNMQVLDPLSIGQNVKEILESDCKAEYDARALYQEAATYCAGVKDYPSRDLFEELRPTRRTTSTSSKHSSTWSRSSACSFTPRRTSASPKRTRRRKSGLILMRCDAGKRAYGEPRRMAARSEFLAMLRDALHTAPQHEDKLGRSFLCLLGKGARLLRRPPQGEGKPGGRPSIPF